MNYDINRVNFPNSARKFRKSEIVYVELKQAVNGLYVQDGASFKQPDTGMFIRGRASESNSGTSQVRYGIEAFFAPKDKALDLEKRFRPGGVAKVMLAKNGKATLKDVVAE